jgi:4-oxalocrotonate tautomerase
MTMPILNISVSAKLDAALSERIATELSELTPDILHKDPDVTSVAITYVSPEHWFVGGSRWQAKPGIVFGSISK